MPGFVLESRDLVPGPALAYRYDPVALATQFPNLDVRFGGQPTAADLVTLSLFGGAPGGQSARVLALHGRELLNLPPPSSLPPQVAVTTDRIGYQRDQPLTMTLHFSQPTPPLAADFYLGLLHPDGTFDSVLIDGAGIHFVPTGGTPSPIVQNASIPADFSVPLAVRPWTQADAAGSYVVFAVVVQPGQPVGDSQNWLGLGYALVTLNP